jgi:hypothetical protein
VTRRSPARRGRGDVQLGARLRGYTTGGTIHLILNNQIGFTTDPREGRSTDYSSDLAKGFDALIVHVNADDAEACLAAVWLAMMYRDKFHGDVVIDRGPPALRPQRGRRAGVHAAHDVRADQAGAERPSKRTPSSLLAKAWSMGRRQRTPPPRTSACRNCSRR